MRLPLVFALALAGGGVALANDRAVVGDSTDHKFVEKAASSGMAEVKISKLAMDRASSTEVKQFARKMVEDHTKANMELKRIAEKKDITMPAMLDEKHERAYEKLAKMSGSDFDREYMKVMAGDHDDAVKLFTDEKDNGHDPDLKSFAMKTLPVIEKHDDMAHSEKQDAAKEKMEKMPVK